MVRKFVKVSLAGLLGIVAVALAFNTDRVRADDKAEKTPTVKEIMKKGHAETEGYMDKIKASAKDGKWDQAKEYAKTLAFFGENLGKNKAPRGDEKSWETLTKKYAENTKAAYKACEDKDEKALAKAFMGINCRECHTEHKNKKK